MISFKSLAFLAAPLTLISCAGFSQPLVQPSPLAKESIRDAAPLTGWAGMEGGTSGGGKASASAIFTVSNVNELTSVLASLGSAPKIIQVSGVIDISNGKKYENFSDQKSRGQLLINSNTTLVGLGNNSGFKNGTVVITNAENVILRNLAIESPVDVEPHYEKGDGWNAEWDGMNIINSKHVWVDHVTLTDGSFTDDKYTKVDGEKYVQHDGLLDIKRGSDLITVSWSHFKNHDKNMLIGHNDKFTDDRDKLRVTINNSIFENTVQRSPRIRFGKIHSYNNIFIGNKKADVYEYMYTYGLGHEGSIISENNAFHIANLSNACAVVKVFDKETASFKDSNSVINNNPLDFANQCKNADVKSPGWNVPYKYVLMEAQKLDENLRNKVGAGFM